MKFGAHLQPDGMTEFRLWAPDVSAVNVEITGGGAHPMQRDADGFFCATLPAPPGTAYRYRISPHLAVPDPASRAQAIDVHGDSVVVDPAYPWQHPGWLGRPWHEAVIYELHTGALGGFAGVKRELPRLAKLGITAVELMPVAEFPGRHSWGYDGVLHYAPDAAYGSPGELKTLIDTAHGLGLMVYLDVVYNHFGPDGNYLNAYAKSFFRDDVHTPWGAAIDFRRPQVRRFYIENALYWLEEFRFDGLRFDAVGQILDPTFLIEMASEIRRRTAGRHVHLMLENEYNEAARLSVHEGDEKYNGQWTDDWHHCMHVLLTGETEGYYEDYPNPAAQLARCLAEGFCYQGEPSRHAGDIPRGTQSHYLPPNAFVICLQNHDQIGNRAFGERLTAVARPDALRAATLLLLLIPQTPMIFMGDEWGETKPFLFFTDHHEELADLVRKGRRKEFSKFAAFADPEKRGQIPDPNALSTFTASIPVLPAAPTEDQKAMQQLYEAAIKLRAAEITPRIPGAAAAGARALGNCGVRACWQMGGGALLTVAANFGPEPVPCNAGPGTLLMSTSAAPSGGMLAAYSAAAWLQTS